MNRSVCLRSLVPTIVVCLGPVTSPIIAAEGSPTPLMVSPNQAETEPTPAPEKSAETRNASSASPQQQTAATESKLITESITEPITIAATRLRGPLAGQPYAAHRYRRSDITSTQARTAVDSLAYSPGVFVQRTAANQASPFIRGLTGEQTLLLFDGVRLSHAMMRPGPNQYAALIPNESLGSIDVILGSSSTVTGSDGLTGAIDYRLADPGRNRSQGVGVYSTLRADTAHGTSAAVGVDGAHENWRWSVEGSLAAYDDLEGGKDAGERLFGSAAGQDTIPNTSYDRAAYAARASYIGFDDHRFDIAFGTNEMSEAPRADGYFENSGSSSRISRSFDPQAFTYLHLRHNWYNPDDDFIDATQTTAWWHQHDERQIRERIRSGRYRRELREDRIDSVGLDTQFTSYLDQHELTYGATIISENTTNSYARFQSPAGITDPNQAVLDNTDPANTTVPDDADYQSLGIFIQDLWTINATWDLLYGLRYSYYRWEADVTGRGYTVDRIDGSTDGLSGQIRAGWQASSQHSGFIGLSQGFRAPNLTNLSGGQDAGSSGNFVAGNPDLDPETSYTAETGYRYQYSDTTWFALDTFFTTINDVVQRVFVDIDNDGNLDGITQNGETAELYGGEFTCDIHLASFTWGKLSLQNATSYVHAFQDVPQADGSVDNQAISRANRLYGKLRLRSDFANDWYATVRTRWADSYDDVAPNDANDVRLTTAGDETGAMPGYAVLDFIIGWQPRAGRSVALLLENLANKTYREAGSSADAPGFNVALNTEWNF